MKPIQPPIEEALFCDLMKERFKYTQAEWDFRVAQYPANLRREVEANKHFDRECVAEEKE